MKQVDAGVLSATFDDLGPGDGPAVVLLHGFPYDVHSYDEVAPALAEAGCRVIVPYLRGYGPTRFLSSETPRSGEQAALGADLHALMQALGLRDAVLGGYDWGGRAACVVAALWPAQVRGLVSCCGYNIQDIAGSGWPAAPAQEHRLWYQYYFHGERGRAGLAADPASVARLLWELWSPAWHFDPLVFAQTAAAFDNPDFTEVVIHSYRHRFGLVAGDPAYAPIERQLASQPSIGVPAIVLHGDTDGVSPVSDSAQAARHFTGPYERRVLPGVGHNVPQEMPRAVVQAVLDLLAR